MKAAARRIDVLGPDESVESRSMHLLQEYHEGKISISDLMGPLFGVGDQTSVIPSMIGTHERLQVAEESSFPPIDDHNKILLSNIHPSDYVNPVDDLNYDLVAIGAGVSGLISVIIGSWLGKKCALIEKNGMGGDCLNTGCVPSKALIACARAAYSVKNLSQFGVHLPEGAIFIDFPHIMNRMREIRSRISHHDSVQRYSREFCKDVFIGSAHFSQNGKICVVGDDGSTRTLSYKKAMIATGASAAIPNIFGLANCPHLTNSNFFNLQEMPSSMIVIGTGPIGMELSQCMLRFGCRVICIDAAPRIMPREDFDAASILQTQLQSEGLEIFTCVRDIKVSYQGPTECCMAKPFARYTVTFVYNGECHSVSADALLNATGRTPNVYDLGLENVGVEWDNRNGIHINEYFQTNNSDIYACGDCAVAYKFTHSADFQARIAVRNMFLGDKNKLSQLLIPWCTYTEPEIAHVGKYEAELEKDQIEHEVFVRHLKDVDRCICDGINQGFVKIIMKKDSDQILGATIVAPNAGDMITEITMAMQYGLSIPQIAGVIHPYPTTQESIRQACLSFNKYFKNPQGVPLATLRHIMNEQDIVQEDEK